MIHHLATRDDWNDRTQSAYAPAGLATEGFVHCSTADQLLRTAHALFHGRTDLLVLDVDEQILRAPVVWEDLLGTGEQFPHVYGSIELDAVSAVRPFPPDTHGRFDWWRPHDPPFARPAGMQSAAVQALLGHLRDHGFDGAPHPLGVELGLELVTYVAGSASLESSAREADAWASLGVLLRRAHDASEGFSTEQPWASGRVQPEEGDIIVHGAIAPGRVIWRSGRAIAIVDWSAARPGSRLVDLGMAALSFGAVTVRQPEERLRLDDSSGANRISALAVGYGDVAPAAIERASTSLLAAEAARSPHDMLRPGR